MPAPRSTRSGSGELMSGLRAISDESDPLSLPDLKSRGDQLLRDAKDAATDAMLASMQREFFVKNRSYGLSEVKWMREKARAAAQAWSTVDGLLSELLLEVERSKNGAS